MAVINTNVKALFSQMALSSSGRAQSVAMQQLSTGKRINSARDDAAGMAIATRMTQQIRGLNQAIRNAGDAITMIQTAEGATNEITDMLQRMRELAVQASNDTNSNDQRSYLDLEFQQLKKQIVQISDQTEWNGFPVLNGSAGERVGERPVYKTVSDPIRNSIFISPSTYIQAKDDTGSLKVTEMDGSGTTPAPFTTSPYKLSGVLTVKGGATPTATFLTTDNKSIDLTISSTAAELAAGVVKFNDSGLNSQVFNDAASVVYTFTNENGNTPAPENLLTSTVSRMDVQVSGSIPPLPPGQLVINGVQIPASFAINDKVSPPNNAEGSAIAKAFAINQKTDQTGVVAVVNENDMIGTAMNQLGTSAATGHLVINGVSTATFTTSVNNPRESRATVIQAINLISDKTGVVAVDTGADSQGITLVAKDGRNIETKLVPTDGTTKDFEFSDRTGIVAGVQAGTYSLESKVETNITISVTNGGDITPSGLTVGTYANHWVSASDPHQAVNTQVRALATGNSADLDTMPKILKTGDLVINGVAIPGATKDDDKLSGVESDQSTNSVREGSAIATANAINSQFDKTGVRAVANPNISIGATTSVDSTNTGAKHLYVNGIDVKVTFNATDSAAQRANNVAQAIRDNFGASGVSATVNPLGGVTLNAEDGRNLAVWFDGANTAQEFGLASNDKNGSPISGVTAVPVGTNAATYKDANVQYGTVGLVSDKPVSIQPGTNGLTRPTDPSTGKELSQFSNFTSLGFVAGTFGGVVQDADNKMTPPRTGRLTFQVGASANQVVTIDLADFGKGGPITSAITWDVDMTAPDPGTPLPAPGTDANGNPVQTPQRSYISSKDAAQSVLTRLDAVMNKVNATRATMGAVMNRLDHVVNNLTNVSMNMSTSRSQIEDADYASSSTELAKTQIMQQAATAVLAQANTSQQTVLKLLGG